MSDVTVIRKAPHRCELGLRHDGEIVRCNVCGTYWSCRSDGNYILSRRKVKRLCLSGDLFGELTEETPNAE